MSEYFDNDCAERSPESVHEDKVYFMPHRAVYKDDKNTSEIRIVFDASAYAPGIPSLNDVLDQGENIVPDLLKVLMNFRVGKIALVADIEKAFLQIEVAEKDRGLLSFLWYDKTGDSPQFSQLVKFRMKRVTFGVNCSPFALAATMKKHLTLQPSSFKKTCDTLIRSFYVDDLVTSCESFKEAGKIYQEAKEIMAKASMNLRKWRSNDFNLQKIMYVKNKNIKRETKVLGMLLFHNEDELSLNLSAVIEKINKASMTKREVLAIVSSIFDPLGFLNPFLIRAKIFLQRLWKANLDWDSFLPVELSEMWSTWCAELPLLQDFSLPRGAVFGSGVISLHIFADVSLTAYGAVAYLRIVKEDGQIECKSFMSKSRVAPPDNKNERDSTLPKFELTAVLCAVRLQRFILENINVKISECVLWSDSKVTLCWIKGRANNWKPYVRNRVIEIQNLSCGEWRHCPGMDNAADLLTSGIKSSQLMDSIVWRFGPGWLCAPSNQWPDEEVSSVDSSHVLAVHTTGSSITEPIFPVEKFSSLEKALRVTAFIKRFVYNLKNSEHRRYFPLTAEELQESENNWIRFTKKEYFSDELIDLKKSNEVGSSSRINVLSPFVDDSEVMRLTGRTQESSLPYNSKYPIILPKKSSLTDKIIWNAYVLTMHGGINSTIVQIRKKYWVIQCRQRVMWLLSRCVVCKKLKVKAANEPFAPVPSNRLTTTGAFKVTGTDFVGPLYIVSETDQREKCYLTLFTCAAVRAVHLELVPSMSTESCMNAIQRFISRRGVPEIMYSDNAKTFKRTSMELQEVMKIIKSDAIQNFASKYRITWKFIVERASWWGGFWERMVKLTKDSLKKSLGQKTLDFDELQTVLSEVKATVNS